MIEMDVEYGPIRSNHDDAAVKSGSSEPYSRPSTTSNAPLPPAPFAESAPGNVGMLKTLLAGLQAAEDAMNTSRRVNEQAARTFEEQAAVVASFKVGVKRMLDNEMAVLD